MILARRALRDRFTADSGFRPAIPHSEQRGTYSIRTSVLSIFANWTCTVVVESIYIVTTARILETGARKESIPEDYVPENRRNRS